MSDRAIQVFEKVIVKPLFNLIRKKTRPVGVPALSWNTSLYQKSDDPLERLAARALERLAEDEYQILSLSYGLGGQDPIPPQKISDVKSMSLIRVMTTGEGGLLRLRNSKTCSEAFKPLLEDCRKNLVTLADEISEALGDQPDANKRDRMIFKHYVSLSPIRRLAVRGFGEGELIEMEIGLRKRLYAQMAIAAE